MGKKKQIKRLRDALDYDPLTGLLVWKVRDDVANCVNTRNAGKPALSTPHVGYYRGTFCGRGLLAHRTAFAIVHGYWPKQVDHINGITTDNRIVNLRASDVVRNHRNRVREVRNMSGVTGVSWNKDRFKWQSNIKVEGLQIYLGLFTQFEDAVAARKAAEIKYGFDPMHGRSDTARAARDLSEAVA